MIAKRPLPTYCLGLILCLLLLLGRGAACAQSKWSKSGHWVTAAPKEAAVEPKSALQPNRVIVVVARPECREVLQPWVRWKQQEGYDVEQLYVESGSRDSIRNLLKERYLNPTPLHPAQGYVLLVGDVDRIQAFIGKYRPSGMSGHVTDLYYGEYTGDYLPEALVGRLPASDTAQLRSMVEKIVAYEQGTTLTNTLLQRALLVAGCESTAPAPTTTNGQVNYLKGLWADQGLTDTICFYNPASGGELDAIKAALHRSNALINYTGHCTRAGWSNPTVTASTLDTMPMTPALFVNNGCLSNAYDGNCFGEQLMRMAHGASAVIGASNETLWEEDYFWSIGARESLTENPQQEVRRQGAFEATDNLQTATQPTMGQLMYYGCRAVSQSTSPFDAFYWETYTLLGDPSTPIWTGALTTLELTADEVRLGDGSITVHALPHTLVTACADTFLLGSALTDDQGDAVLTLSRSIADTWITLTASKRHCLPAIATLRPQPPHEARLILDDARLDDSLLTLRMLNRSSFAANGHQLWLTQTAQDSADGCTFAAPSTITISLDSGASDTIGFSLQGIRAGVASMLAMHLHLADTLGRRYATLALRFDMEERRPQIVAIQLTTTDGIPARQLYLNQSYRASVLLSMPTESISCQLDGIEQAVGRTDSLLYAFDFTPTRNHFRFDIAIDHEGWHTHKSYWMMAGQSFEDFEETPSSLPWYAHQDTAWMQHGWQVAEGEAHSGTHALRSAPIGDRQSSLLILDIETVTDDSVAFWSRVSSEGSSDKLLFYIDNREKDYWSGNGRWKRTAYPLPAGRHELRWKYSKDVSESAGSDCAWIDDIELPLCLWSDSLGRIRPGSERLDIFLAEAESGALSIAPNPADSYTVITYNGTCAEAQASLYDLQGRKIDCFSLQRGMATQYSTHHLRFGVYLLLLQTDKGSTAHKITIAR